MTHDEAALLKGYLRLDGPAFEDWLRSTRDGSDAGELEYKAALAEARAWERGFQEGAKACAAWVEEQEDSALALSQNPPCRRRRRREPTGERLDVLDGATRKDMILEHPLLEEAMERKRSEARSAPLCVSCWGRPVSKRRNWQQIPLAWWRHQSEFHHLCGRCFSKRLKGRGRSRRGRRPALVGASGTHG